MSAARSGGKLEEQKDFDLSTELHMAQQYRILTRDDLAFPPTLPSSHD